MCRKAKVKQLSAEKFREDDILIRGVGRNFFIQGSINIQCIFSPRLMNEITAIGDIGYPLPVPQNFVIRHVKFLSLLSWLGVRTPEVQSAEVRNSALLCQLHRCSWLQKETVCLSYAHASYLHATPTDDYRLLSVCAVSVRPSRNSLIRDFDACCPDAVCDLKLLLQTVC